jgi:hypothetical protein
MLHLIMGTNKEGHDIALDRVVETCLDIRGQPTKGALSLRKSRISSDFSKENFEYAVTKYQKKCLKYKGVQFLAMDGDQYNLPRTAELLKQGFSGYPCNDKKETRLLKMYTVTLVDCISRVPLNWAYSTNNNEISLACDILKQVKSGACISYDRLYLCDELLKGHKIVGVFGIWRCKSGGTFSEIEDFANSTDLEKTVKISGVSLRLMKKDMKNGDVLILATNLGLKFSNEEIFELYSRRWESETKNKEITSVQKLEQFHSKTKNGILHEIYTSFWLNVLVNAEISGKHDLAGEFMQDIYHKPNTKRILAFIANNTRELLVAPCVVTVIKFWRLIERSKEKRKRYSRWYPREIKYGASDKNYVRNTLVARSI